MDITLEHRIRKSPPLECCVVPGSIPILAFGNFQTAIVATLGLNPSRVEFLDRSGRLLVGAHARFETFSSLRVDTLSEASSEVATRVVNSCESYFRKNPYRLWFNPLDEIVGGLGASYCEGSACHLDLAQWATDPTWGKLEPRVRARLVADGLPFLRWQLSHSSIRTLLLNGRAVLNAFQTYFSCALSPVETLPGPLGRSVSVFVGSLPSGLKVIGWPTNLQSSFGVTREFRAALRTVVSELGSASGATLGVAPEDAPLGRR